MVRKLAEYLFSRSDDERRRVRDDLSMFDGITSRYVFGKIFIDLVISSVIWRNGSLNTR